MTRVLLTGASGFIALHILEVLLKRGYSVRGTVRSQEKANKIATAYPEYKERLDFAIVEDIAKPGAFDQAVISEPPFDYILHTASPVALHPTDVKAQLIDPAVQGTVGILEAVKNYAPTVKRVVITSSISAIYNPAAGFSPEKTWSEVDWNPATLEGIQKDPADGYRLSKKLAEKAAWDYVKNEKLRFDLVTINPPCVVGPVHPWIASLEFVNMSNKRVLDMVTGKMKERLVPTPIWLCVDVRDVAIAHVNAIERPEAGGKRFLVTASQFSNQQIADVIVKNFPQLADKLPATREPNNGFPEGGVYNGDNTRSKEILGLEYTPLEKSITDLVQVALQMAAA